MAAPTEAPERVVEHKLSGEKLLTRIKQLIHEGNVRRITIKNDEGHPLLEIPLTIGVVGTVFAPVLVAVGAMAALTANYTIEVEKVEHAA
jgi:hypothetical protein